MKNFIKYANDFNGSAILSFINRLLICKLLLKTPNLKRNNAKKNYKTVT